MLFERRPTARNRYNRLLLLLPGTRRLGQERAQCFPELLFEDAGVPGVPISSMVHPF